MKELFLIAITQPLEVLISKYIFSVFVSVSFSMFLCNKGHLVTAYLDTISMTLVLSTQKSEIYGDVPIGISSCHKVRTEGYVTNVTNTDIELVYILFNNETTFTNEENTSCVGSYFYGFLKD